MSHSDLFQDRWFDSVMKLQTEQGCFTNYLLDWHGIKKKVKNFELNKKDFEILDGICNLHTTTMGGILIGLGIRYTTYDISYAWGNFWQTLFGLT